MKLIRRQLVDKRLHSQTSMADPEEEEECTPPKQSNLIHLVDQSARDWRRYEVVDDYSTYLVNISFKRNENY